jgi:hypothetical protein
MPEIYNPTASLGRISGKLLSDNLVRQGVDLTFRNGPLDPDLVYFDVTGNKLGFNTDNPLYDLDVNGLLDTDILSITTRATIGNVKINADGSFGTVTGALNISPLGADPTIFHDRLTTSLLQINDNVISAKVTDGNVIFDPNGTGVINLQSSVANISGVDVTGNINIHGNLSYGGSLILGDAAADALDFNGEFNKALIPGVDGYYNLGAPGKSWALLNVTNAEIGNLSQNSILVDNKLYIANSANDITATQGNDPIYVNPNTRVIYLEDLKIENNVITNQLNTPLTITSNGTGYVKFNDTNAFIIPVGNNSERGYTEVGETRWNTEVGYLECFDGSVYYVATGPGEFLTLNDMQELGNVYSLILG